MNSIQAAIQKNEKMIGTVASTVSIIMFFSLIEILVSNFQHKSDIYIQPLATSLNGFLWSIYAYGKKDNFLLIPNILALIIGILTVISAFI
jgi:hypothetical protein